VQAGIHRVRILRSLADAAQPWLFAALNAAKRTSGMTPHLDTNIIPYELSLSLGHLGMEVRSKKTRAGAALPFRGEIMDGFGRPCHRENHLRKLPD
jgi:hypothetical protein